VPRGTGFCLPPETGSISTLKTLTVINITLQSAMQSRQPTRACAGEPNGKIQLG